MALSIFNIRSAFLVCLLVAAAALQGGLSEARASDLERTWERGWFILPQQVAAEAEKVRSIRSAEKTVLRDRRPARLPVVVYMHGCTGLGTADKKVMRQFSRAGFAVVAPDSMARKYRPLQCASRSKQGGANVFVFDFRQAEINYAVQQLAFSDWADADNLFLVGVSEGGLATAHYRGDIFRARIITQWTCHGAPLVQGISGAPDTPILAIVRKDDPWYQKNPRQRGDCGAFFGDRPGSQSLVLADGDDHLVMDDERIIAKMVAFLRANRTRPNMVTPPR